MVDCLANLLFFDIQLLYYYTDLNSSIICCLFSGDVYFYFSIFILFSFAFECNSFENGIVLEILQYFLFYQLFYCQLNHQLHLLFFELLFLKQFLLHLLYIPTHYQEVLTILVAHVFSNFSCMCTNIFRKL